MKNLIPYNLFEMSKLNIQDYIKDIEHIRKSVDYFNTNWKYNEIELNDNIYKVEFKLATNNLTPRLFGIAAEVDDCDYLIMSIRIKKDDNITYSNQNIMPDKLNYYLVVDSDCSLNIYDHPANGRGIYIFLKKISINLLKNRDTLINVIFDNIKEHNKIFK
jgi:hypothetical protein